MHNDSILQEQSQEEHRGAKLANKKNDSIQNRWIQEDSETWSCESDIMRSLKNDLASAKISLDAGCRSYLAKNFRKRVLLHEIEIRTC